LIAQSAKNAEERGRRESDQHVVNHPAFPKIVEHFKAAPVAINLPLHVLPRLTESGRFRTMLDGLDSEGTNIPSYRMGVEERMFCIPKETANENDRYVSPTANERPLYGALHINYNNPLRAPYGPAPHYGLVHAVLKPHVKDRCTFTPDDSFGCSDYDVFHGTHMPALAIASLKKRPSLRGSELDGFDDNGVFESLWPAWGSYVEAQIHGGVQIGDIQELHSRSDSAEPNQLAVDFAKKHNIKYTHHIKNRGEWINRVVHDPHAIETAKEGI